MKFFICVYPWGYYQSKFQITLYEPSSAIKSSELFELAKSGKTAFRQWLRNVEIWGGFGGEQLPFGQIGNCVKKLFGPLRHSHMSEKAILEFARFLHHELFGDALLQSGNAIWKTKIYLFQLLTNLLDWGRSANDLRHFIKLFGEMRLLSPRHITKYQMESNVRYTYNIVAWPYGFLIGMVNWWHK